MLNLCRPLCAWLTLFSVTTSVCVGQESVDQQKLNAAIDKGVAYLKATQAEDGSWSRSNSLGVTGLATYALIKSGVPLDDPAVEAGLKNILSAENADGGFYRPDSKVMNYETAIVLQTLVAANKDKRYDSKIEKAVDFVKELQWDEDEVGSAENDAFGGAGYGSHSRPDMSNTAFFIEALHTAGVSASDPAMQKALLFVSRCQNLKSEHNQTKYADKVEDGGFYYTIAAGGSSPAGETPEGGLRSYASITYAGLKSMIYAGVSPDDVRVKAAQGWIQKFYSLDENPGMGQQGLYYYYQTFAKTLDAFGDNSIKDADGNLHDWRADLANTLIAKQNENGSWANPTVRWMEGDADLVTAYALMSLQYCKQPAK
ncbi:prenyltransferase/squalene oxidase repeat-containing protein [Planctomicrobium sp. SH668]|uniref:prenyltransferase/squalene oxidase repeat-containing protein n=1 Tax=Planctomicrobium sp. SH668 TaxID=3448126 RepID=UPI003F5B9FBD